MENILLFFKRYGFWFVFVLLEAGSFVVFFSFNGRQGSVFLSSVNVVAASVNGLQRGVVDFFNLSSVNKRLTEENVVLQQEVGRLSRELTRERSTSVQEAREWADSLAMGYERIMARVVSASIHRKENYIVLDKGRADGVGEEMGVVCSDGVVGIVFLVDRHYCMVLPTINSRSSISCTFRGKSYYGYLQWGGGDAREAYLTDVPRYANVSVGDVIETSGYSAMFPSGFYVGKVLKITDAEDGLSLKVHVRLGTEFASLSDVCILKNNDRNEIDSLNMRLQRYWGDV